MPTCQNHIVALTNKEYQQHGRSQACTITGDIHHQQQLKQMPNQSLGHWAVLQSSKYKCDGSIANIGGHIVEQGSTNWFQATRMGVG